MNQSNTYIVIDNVSVDGVGNVGNSHRIDQTTALKPKVNYNVSWLFNVPMQHDEYLQD